MNSATKLTIWEAQVPCAGFGLEGIGVLGVFFLWLALRTLTFRFLYEPK